MNPAIYIAIFLPLFILFITSSRNKRIVAARTAKKKGTNKIMIEMAKNFIGKECLIYTINSDTVQGMIKQVIGNAVLVENKENLQAVNLDFVVKIREYPRNKKGKKKAVVC